MNVLVLAAIAASTVLPLRAQTAGKLGAGALLGEPTGLSLKYWMTSSSALDGGVGFSGDPAFYLGVLFHGWDMFPQPRQGRLAGYLGLGPRVETAREGEFGFRTLAGMAYWPAGAPVEVFVEAGPVFRLTQGGAVDADGGLGVRYYFGGRAEGSRSGG